ncbi:hypothetical protein NUW58_g3590 [Xylaria curta]|uniref:Uncharacterized protein n=1 Tax=Xylaria curta TaxID=42375 RepID=A0ACC1PBI0_9PEZI|nr:hypothetical protein NUW58_g3590 [Xylaria curta]
MSDAQAKTKTAIQGYGGIWQVEICSFASGALDVVLDELGPSMNRDTCQWLATIVGIAFSTVQTRGMTDQIDDRLRGWPPFIPARRRQLCLLVNSIDNGPNSIAQDVGVIHHTVSELVIEHDVVVVMHSISGTTGGTALKSLIKDTCLVKELKGRVVGLIYVVAFLVPEEFQHSPRGTRDKTVPARNIDLEVSATRFLPP